MLKRTQTQALKESAASVTDLAAALAKDKKFRKELLSGIRHGVVARRRASRRFAFIAAATRVVADPKLKNELRKMTKNLEKAWVSVSAPAALRRRTRRLQLQL